MFAPSKGAFSNEVEPWAYGVLAASGLVAGFVNVMAGGGSLLTMPIMIFLGMSPALANGTNRIALVAQNLTAITTFKRKGFSDFKLSLTLGLCTLPGAIVGAIAAVRIDPLWFQRLLAVVMVGVLLQMFRKKKKPGDNEEAEKHTFWAHVAMVFVGFYGGFIQAGVGFILMAILHGLLRLDLVRVNMHKVFVVALYMVPSLVVFALLDQVNWQVGFIVAIGNAIGAWIAARLQMKKGERVVRVVFGIAIIAMSIKLFLG